VRRALHAEWEKTWTEPGAPWLLAALVALTAAVSGLTLATARCPAAGCGQDPARISLAGVYAGQAAAALAGVLAAGGEYGTGMIAVSLAAVPRRGRLLAAKAGVLAVTAGAASAVTAVTVTVAGLLLLPGHGFTAERGFDLAGPASWRAALCAALCLTLTALLGLGITVAVRDSVAASGVTLAVLYLFPVAAGLVSDPVVQRHLEQAGPLTAGADSLATAGLAGLPLTPWQGLGVAAAWAAGALALGAAALLSRDA
jgi:ABC-2 type transport system permease protein